MRAGGLEPPRSYDRRIFLPSTAFAAARLMGSAPAECLLSRIPVRRTCTAPLAPIKVRFPRLRLPALRPPEIEPGMHDLVISGDERVAGQSYCSIGQTDGERQHRISIRIAVGSASARVAVAGTPKGSHPRAHLLVFLSP